MGRIGRLTSHEFHLADAANVPASPLVGREAELEACGSAWGVDLIENRLRKSTRRPAMHFRLHGKPGVGKSDIVYELARRLNLDLYVMLGHEDLAPDELCLTLSPGVTASTTSLNLRASPLATAIYTGSAFYFDRIDRVPRKTLSVLASVLDSRQSVYSNLLGVFIGPRDKKAAAAFRFCCSLDVDDNDSLATLPEYIAQRCVPVIRVKPLERRQLVRTIRTERTHNPRTMEDYKARYIQRSREHITLHMLEHLARHTVVESSGLQLSQTLLSIVYLREKALGASSPQSQSLLAETASYARSLEMHGLAIQLWRRLRDRLSIEADDHADSIAEINLALASSYLENDMSHEAETAVRQVLEYCHDDRDKRRLASRALNMLGLTKRRTFEFDEAAASYERALAIDTELEDAESVATLTSNLGVMHWYAGRYAESQDKLEKALMLWEAIHGEYSASAVDVTNCTARLYMSLGRFADAARLFARALRIRRRIRPRSHSDYAFTFDGLALMYLEVGKLRHAKKHAQRALELRRRGLGEKHDLTSESLLTLGRVQVEAREHESARLSLERALAHREDRLRDDHPHIARTRIALGACLLAQGDLRRAEEYLVRGHQVLTRAGTTHLPDSAWARVRLAELRLAQHDPEAAMNELRPAIEDQVRVLGSTHPATKHSQDLLRQANRELEQHREQ